MPVKIGGMYYDVFPKEAINLRGRAKYIFPVKFRSRFCPACGQPLSHKYALAIKLTEKRYFKIYDDYCPICDAFITTNIKFVKWLRKSKEKDNPEICNEYNMAIFPQDYLDIFNNQSVYWQLLLISKSKAIAVSLTCDDTQINEDNYVYPYTSKEGISLLRDLVNKKKHFRFHEEDYVLADCFVKRIRDRELAADVNQAINSMRFSPSETPEVSAADTVYIYNGNIRCHERHHLFEYKARVAVLDQTMGFYVEYCHECDRFYMKHDDYESYLGRYHFFPFRLNRDNVIYRGSFQNRAEKSPLKEYGYSVSQADGLSERQRQLILAHVIDQGVLPKRKVLDYLEMFIREGQSSMNKIVAVEKWTKDKEYVLNYSKKDVPIVNILGIKRLGTK